MPEFMWKMFQAVSTVATGLGVRAAIAVLCCLATPAVWAQPPQQILGLGLHVLTDGELDSIRAEGLYFRMDMSVEVFNPGDVTPQTVVNTSNPIVIPTGSSGSSSAGGATPLGGNITLSDNAQSGINSLVNVIGSGSVINVGVNVINLNSSTNDTIYTTNNNVGVFGTGSTPSVQLPVINP